MASELRLAKRISTKRNAKTKKSSFVNRVKRVVRLDLRNATSIDRKSDVEILEILDTTCYICLLGLKKEIYDILLELHLDIIDAIKYSVGGNSIRSAIEDWRERHKSNKFIAEIEYEDLLKHIKRQTCILFIMMNAAESPLFHKEQLNVDWCKQVSLFQIISWLCIMVNATKDRRCLEFNLKKLKKLRPIVIKFDAFTDTHKGMPPFVFGI